MHSEVVRRGRVAVVLVITAAVLAACRDSTRSAVPSATVPTAPPQTTTTNPYAVPPVIDAAYVNRVLGGLDAIAGDATRLVVSTKTIPREAFDRIKAIYRDDADADRILRGYSEQLSLGLPGAKPNPGDKRSSVKELISTSNSCVYVRVERDYTAISENAFSGISEWIALRPLDSARDPYGYNVTGWAYIYEGFTRQRTQPDQNPCLI